MDLDIELSKTLRLFRFINTLLLLDTPPPRPASSEAMLLLLSSDVFDHPEIATGPTAIDRQGSSGDKARHPHCDKQQQPQCLRVDQLRPTGYQPFTKLKSLWS